MKRSSIQSMDDVVVAVAEKLPAAEALKRKEVRGDSGWKSSCATRLLKSAQSSKPFQSTLTRF
jgi:hypothetical protein